MATAPPWISRWASLCPTSGLPWVSALSSFSLAPLRQLMPPSWLTASTASLAPLSICWPSAADAPLSGCSDPIVIVSPDEPPPPLPPAPGGVEPPQAVSSSGTASAMAGIQGFLMSSPDCQRSSCRNGWLDETVASALCGVKPLTGSAFSHYIRRHQPGSVRVVDGVRCVPRSGTAGPVRAAAGDGCEGGDMADGAGTEATARVADVLLA